MTDVCSRLLVLGSKQIKFPVYFPSISSVKTPLQPVDYLQTLTALDHLTDKFLVSAYDLPTLEQSRTARECIDAARDAGSVILLDSGNYESFWKKNQANWRQSDFHSILDEYPCDIAFGFDEQQPPKDPKNHIDLVIERWEIDQQRAGDCRIIPIVHEEAHELPELCREIVRRSGVEFIAVAERRLGNGLIERSHTIRNIRTSLDSTGNHVFLHVLGTGNPISMAVFTMHGADSFDGLEWCQTVVDHETALLYHLSQFDFFNGQTRWSEIELPFHIKVLAHNLEFYKDWMDRLRKADTTELQIEFCRLNFPARIYRKCVDFFSWIQP